MICYLTDRLNFVGPQCMSVKMSVSFTAASYSVEPESLPTAHAGAVLALMVFTTILMKTLMT